VKRILSDDRFELIPSGLTGPDIAEKQCTVNQVSIALIHPEDRESAISDIIDAPFISVDYTHPSAVNSNAQFYSRCDFPFVMGTTGGDRTLLDKTIRDSSIAAVIAPNMAKQIVGFQAMMRFAADTFPNLFSGYRLKIKESHQHGKADTSGTAKAMVQYFNRLGIPFSEDSIEQERNPEIQKTRWEIPEAYLKGHGWHTYTLMSADNTVKFEFTHNVNGRDVYAKGTLDAVAFLSKKVAEGAKGKVYTMIDVLKSVKTTEPK
jgi:4-hydroxy-tetrahydrodipicolinate reductase